jgi:hypothetical protein
MIVLENENDDGKGFIITVLLSSGAMISIAWGEKLPYKLSMSFC